MTREQEALILDNRDLVARVAWRVAQRMPPFVEMDDLISLGNLGLCQAAERFNSRLHCSFRAFAMLRIRGAMIDAYRGRNYPRLLESMPESWLQGGKENGEGEEDADFARRTPEELIVRESILDVLMDQEAAVIVSIDAVRARAQLNEEEGKVLDRHLRGVKLAAIGREHGKSAPWARYIMFSAKHKLRKSLLGEEKEAA